MALAKLITWTSEPKSLEIRLVVRARFSDTPLRTWCMEPQLFDNCRKIDGIPQILYAYCSLSSFMTMY